MVIAEFFRLDSIEHEQLALFGYSFGNIGLIKLKLFDTVKLRFEQTSTIDESLKKTCDFLSQKEKILSSMTYFEYIDKK